MIRRPPRSTLFPTRRSSDLPDLVHRHGGRRRLEDHERRHELHADLRQGERSEEHTSELQSLAYLVCRLLLEKKKKRKSEGLTSTSLHITYDAPPLDFRTL